jgi:hypothetical protein
MPGTPSNTFRVPDWYEETPEEEYWKLVERFYTGEPGSVKRPIDPFGFSRNAAGYQEFVPNGGKRRRHTKKHKKSKKSQKRRGKKTQRRRR